MCPEAHALHTSLTKKLKLKKSGENDPRPDRQKTNHCVSSLLAWDWKQNGSQRCIIETMLITK